MGFYYQFFAAEALCYTDELHNLASAAKNIFL
jgi:hypothetical protein